MEQAKQTRRPMLVALVLIIVVGIATFAIVQLVQNMPTTQEDGTNTNVGDARPGDPDAGNPPDGSR